MITINEYESKLALSTFEFHLLDKSFDRENFDCGYLALNNFLKTKARQNQQTGFNRTFVVIKSDDVKKMVLGYYSLSMGEINLMSLPENLLKKLPKHPVPVVRMGRLAVDKSQQGQGIGHLLLVDALKRIIVAASSVGVYAVVVDAKNEDAKRFYLKYGFVQLVDESMSLFIPVETFAELK